MVNTCQYLPVTTIPARPNRTKNLLLGRHAICHVKRDEPQPLTDQCLCISVSGVRIPGRDASDELTLADIWHFSVDHGKGVWAGMEAEHEARKVREGGSDLYRRQEQEEHPMPNLVDMCESNQPQLGGKRAPAVTRTGQ